MKINPKKLKDIAEARLIDRKELAKMAGVSSATVSNWMKGKGEPRIKNIKALTQALEVKPSQILTKS